MSEHETFTLPAEGRANRAILDELNNPLLLAEISNKADLAARNRKVRKHGYEATDVYSEVIVDIMSRAAQFGTLSSVVADALKDHVPAIEDPSAPEAVSLLIGRLCAAAAMRLVRTNEREVPVGDGTAVAGEEVPKEQRQESSDERARGNDRQMTAVLSRKAMHRGIHRADVYGVAESSRMAMRDCATRYFSETDQEVMAALFDSNWAPSRPAEASAWERAFQGDSIADVLYGIKPNFSLNDWEEAKRFLLATFGMELPNMAHVVKVDAKTDEHPNQYPPHFVYKPLSLTTTRSGRKGGFSEADKAVCIHCRHHDHTNPFVKAARKAHNDREWAKFNADNSYERKPYQMPPLGKNCPPGRVTMFRQLHLPGLLPQDATDGEKAALRRGLRDFAEFIRKERRDFWTREATRTRTIADYRMYLEEQDGIGKGEPWPMKVAVIDRTKPYVNIWHDDDDTAKEARRWALMHGLGETDIYDAFTITLANAKPGTNGTPFLPGVERWNRMETDMLHDWIHVSKHGNMVMDGVEGTFVQGLPGLLEWTDQKNLGRKVVAGLIRNRGTLLLNLIGAC